MGDLIRREQPAFPEQPAWSNRPSVYARPIDDDSVDIRRYFNVLLKRRWLIVAVVTTVLALVALQSFTTTPIYRSTVKVQIDPESANILPYKDLYESTERYLSSEIYLQTQLEVLRSRALARRVADRLNLANDPRFNSPVRQGIVLGQIGAVRSLLSGLFGRSNSDPSTAAAAGSAEKPEWNKEVIDRLRLGLEIEQSPNSRLVGISWTSPSPELAAVVADTFAEEFIELTLQTKFEATQRASEFLKKQMQDLKVKVEKSEEELVRYARANNILNIDQRGSIVHQTLEDFNRQMTEVEGDLISRTAQYQAVKDATVENFPQSLRTPSIQLLEERLFGLQQNLASLSAQFGSQWPAVVQVREQIEEVKTQLKYEKQETLERTRSEYRVAVSRQRMLQGALERQKAQANQLNEDSIQYNILQREVDTNRQLYEGLLQRLKEASVSAGMRSSNVHVVDKAEVPPAPYEPQRAADLALGFGVGLLIAIGLAFLMEYLDNTLKTPDDLEQAVGLASLGVIPTMGLLPSGGSRLLAPRSLESGGEKGLTTSQHNFRVWEAYRSLRTSILLSHSGKPPRTILMTSAVPGEGKTTTVANTGVVLAQTGARTLLIDLDMRRPSLGGVFGAKGAQGISAYLSGNADLSSQIRQTSYPNLFLLPAGLRPPNPAELIGSERMQTALRLLGDYFKYIIIDSPPVLSVSDPLLLANQVDGVVLVVRGGATPKEAVRRAGDSLMSVGAHLLGAMINNVDMDAPEYVYYYRHYYDERYNVDTSQAAS